MGTLLTMEVAKLANGLGKCTSTTFLLQRSNMLRIQGQVLKSVIIKDVYLRCVKRSLDQVVKFRIDQAIITFLLTRCSSSCERRRVNVFPYDACLGTLTTMQI